MTTAEVSGSIEVLTDPLLPPKTRRLLSKVCNFAQKTSEDLRSFFWQKIAAYQDPKYHIDQELLDQIKTEGEDQPSFLIADALSSRQILDDMNFGEVRIGQDSLLLVFKMPPTLARRWNENHKWRAISRDVSRQTRKAIACLGTSSLTIDRLNAASDHDPNKYHYIWEVYRP